MAHFMHPLGQPPKADHFCTYYPPLDRLIVNMGARTIVCLDASLLLGRHIACQREPVTIGASVAFGTLSVRVSILDSDGKGLGSATAGYPLHRQRDNPDYATRSHFDYMGTPGAGHSRWCIRCALGRYRGGQ
jgi:hypothetical protein